MRVKNIYQIGMLLCLTAAVALTACSKDSVQDGTQDGPADRQRQLNLMFYSQQYQEESATGDRRALPTGYVPYNVPQGISLIGYIAPQEGRDVAARIFSMGEDDNHWKTNITIDDPAAPYYLYGFMPVGEETSTDIAISLLDGRTNYQPGAKITIRNMKALTTQDPCVIVAVKKATATQVENSTSIVNADVQLGQFSYQFDEVPGQEYVYLLFDHLFGALQFEMKVDEDYGKLRNIRLKSVQLSALTAKTVDAVVRLSATNDGTSPLTGITPITFTTKSVDTTNPATVTLYEKTESEDEKDFLPTNAYRPLPNACCIPTNVTAFKLTTEYDVYDSEENLIREGCKAENAFNLTISSDNLKPGRKHKIQIEVKPTFLYVLSDPDLDMKFIIQ